MLTCIVGYTLYNSGPYDNQLHHYRRVSSRMLAIDDLGHPLRYPRRGYSEVLKVPVQVRRRELERLSVWLAQFRAQGREEEKNSQKGEEEKTMEEKWIAEDKDRALNEMLGKAMQEIRTQMRLE